MTPGKCNFEFGEMKGDFKHNIKGKGGVHCDIQVCPIPNVHILKP